VSSYVEVCSGTQFMLFAMWFHIESPALAWRRGRGFDLRVQAK
jgi:hypothetical protein